MNTLNHLIIFTASIWLTSCSFLLNIDNKKQIVKKKSYDKNYCLNNLGTHKQITTKHPYIKDHFLRKISSYKRPFSQIETFVILSLVHINLRPDIVTPTSGLQLMIKEGKKIKYFEFLKQKDQDYPLFLGLEYLLKIDKSKLTLMKLAKITKILFPGPYPISKILANQLTAKQSQLIKYEVFKRHYFKSNQILLEGESLSGIDPTKIIKTYIKKKNKNILKKETTFTSELIKVTSSNHYLCNQDLNQSMDSNFNITEDDGKRNVPLAFSMKENHSVLALISANSNDKDIRPLFDTPLFTTYKTDFKATFCYNQKENASDFLQLFSISGRDTSQFLQNFLHVNTGKLSRKSEILEIIEFPRSLFLKSPKRFIFESERSHKKYTNRFLSMEFPIYHSDKLGEVWAFNHSSSSKTFISDSRSKTYHSCL